MINTMEMFSGLSDVKIEGMEMIVAKYKTISEVTKKKNYDVLDHRKGEVRLILTLEAFFFPSILYLSFGFDFSNVCVVILSGSSSAG